MAFPVRIDCVQKDPRFDEHHAIQRVGGLNADGTRWELPLAQAIQGVLDKQWSFYTLVNGIKADVYVRRSPKSGYLYLTTSPDGYTANNLLYLSACPFRAA